MLSEPAHLFDITDLGDDALTRILAGPLPDQRLAAGTTVGLLFLESSLRTRFGFATAAARLGATPLSVTELRSGPEMSSAESFADTVRAVAGMSDLVVVRSGSRLDRTLIRRLSPVPVINGGDRGGEHPTQALIDLAAMQRFAGPVGELNVGICGDLTMRASTSLLNLLARRPPRTLRLIAPPPRSVPVDDLAEPLRRRANTTDVADFSDLDVLLMTGLPPGPDGALSDEARAAFVLSETSIRSLPDHAVVLSPMPMIDELTDGVRADPRIRIHEHGDLGVPVRMAVLQVLLENRLHGA